WASSKNEKGITFAPADARKSDVNVVIPAAGEVKEIVIRGRTKVAGQVLTVYVDGNRIGDGRFESDWSTIRIPAKGLTPGLHGIDYVFSKSGAIRADVDWMLLALEAGSPEPVAMPRVLPNIKMDKRPRRALIAPTARSYSFFIEPPADASLIFDYGSAKGATFKVLAETDKGGIKELWSGTGADEWQEQVVDLSAYAGKAVRLSLVTEGADGVAGWGEPLIVIAKAPEPVMKEGKAPKNVILILMDTNRADNFAAFNPKNKVKTPAFDAFAAKSLVFENAYNQENWTKPSVATTLTGTYPDTHKTKKDSSALPADVEMISEVLKKKGFQTAGFVANGYVSEKFGFEKGWDTYKNYIRLSKPSQAEHVYGDSLAWLKEHKDEKYFLYIQTIDPHVPYRHKGEATSQYYAGNYDGALGNSISNGNQTAAGKVAPSADDLKWLKAMYYGETTHHDTEMGKFFTELETMGVLDDTLIIVTNDHGEELGEHKKFGHGHSLYEELLRAPLVIHYPPLIRPSVLTNEVAENVDISPTIVDMLGLKPMAKADGLSLKPLLMGEPVQRPYYAMSEFMETKRAIRVGSWKMIWSGGLNVEVYHSATDRSEKKNLAKKSLIARRLLEVHAGEAQAAYDKKQRMQDITTKHQFEAGVADIDPETRKQLEALGYFGDK
ncbi:MAG: sulfatase, partial [Kofleriaceae bacterium]|nr:sulfatase [Kofleriaceae bacterium]